VKGKVYSRTGLEGPEGEYRYSSTLSLTLALNGMCSHRHAPAALPPGKTRYPLYRRLSGPHSRSGRVRKISPPTGIRSPDRPARSESLYRLRYPGPFVFSYIPLQSHGHSIHTNCAITVTTAMSLLTRAKVAGECNRQADRSIERHHPPPVIDLSAGSPRLMRAHSARSSRSWMRKRLLALILAEP
jgi:hypothetical protein